MFRKQAILYKQRWDRVQKAQNAEFQTTPLPLKFKQLCFLMDSFRFMPADHKREKEISRIRQRWLTLRKQRNNGR